MAKDSKKSKKKHMSQFNPSFRNDVSGVYIPWFIALSFFVFLLGFGSMACAALVKVKDSNIDNLIFHVWVAAPLIVVAIFGFASAITRRKAIVNIFMILAFFTMVVCAIGAVSGGLIYWEDDWVTVKKNLDTTGGCVIGADTKKCVCKDVLKMPASVDDCDDLEVITLLLIVEFSLAAVGTILSFLAVLLSLMSNCCGPWTYIYWYDQTADPDHPHRRSKKRSRPSKPLESGVRSSKHMEYGVTNNGYKH